MYEFLQVFPLCMFLIVPPLGVDNMKVQVGSLGQIGLL